MGLDQYAYYLDDKNERVELAYWRKHPNLQGWMEALWEKKGCPVIDKEKEQKNRVHAPGVYTYDEEAQQLIASTIVADMPTEEELNNPAAPSDKPPVFNTIPLALTLEDLDALEKDVRADKLPATQGFFFGNDSDFEYKHNDLEFVEKARDAINNGFRVFYDSWW